MKLYLRKLLEQEIKYVTVLTNKAKAERRKQQTCKKKKTNSKFQDEIMQQTITEDANINSEAERADKDKQNTEMWTGWRAEAEKMFFTEERSYLSS